MSPEDFRRCLPRRAQHAWSVVVLPDHLRTQDWERAVALAVAVPSMVDVTDHYLTFDAARRAAAGAEEMARGPAVFVDVPVVVPTGYFAAVHKPTVDQATATLNQEPRL